MEKKRCEDERLVLGAWQERRLLVGSPRLSYCSEKALFKKAAAPAATKPEGDKK